MTGLSIQFNRLGASSSYVDSQKIFPSHKKSIEECLGKIFQEKTAILPKEKFPFQIRFKPGKTVLKIGDRETSLRKSPELDRVERILRYYQHTGHLPRSVMSAKEAIQRDAETKKSIQAVNQASIPGANGNILAGMRLADDTISLTRNIIFALSEFGSKDPIGNHLGYYAGIFWSFFALRELDDGLIELKRSKLISDSEGQRRAEARILSGSIVSAGSLSYLGGKSCDMFAAAHTASFLLGAANILFGVGALLATGTSFLGAVRCDRFNRRLGAYLENQNLTEVERMQGALQFLKDSITVTPEEREAIVFEINQRHADWTPEQKQRLIRQKIADLTEGKVKHMKRRTSNRSLGLILSRVDLILAKLANPATSMEGIKEAVVLIDTVQKESRIKMNLYILGLLAAFMSFVGMMIMIFMSAGTIPFVLYGIAGTIYLCLTIYTVAGMLLKNDNDSKLIELHPLQNLSHIISM